MTNFREKTIWKGMRDQLPNAPRHIHLQRVEGVNYPVGFPDVIVYCNARVGFLELKQHTKTRRIRLTPQQKLFLGNAKLFGISTYIVASDETKVLKFLNPTPNVLNNNAFSDEDIDAEWPLKQIDWTEFGLLFN
jgi:hypothetical protein